ncbi:MAG: AAA family ATPase, partial [Chitinophaga rupis]
MDIPRFLANTIEKDLGKQKVIMLYGSRRVGKTTLIRDIAERHQQDVLLLQGEDMNVIALLQQRTIANYERLLRNKKILIIDEAQVIPNIGKSLKLMIDNIKDITIIATGSSSFDLISSAGEPLVGRQLVYQLYPIAQAELSSVEDLLT